jgi:tRNA(Ile)-lysidine synthase
LIAKLAAVWPADEWRDVTVLVAVSGGADSVALVRGLHELRVTGEGRLILAHYNHCVRGEESDADQRFVEDFARELGCEFVTESAPSPALSLAASPALPSEAALRDLRYDFLKRAANQTGARYVATAHTADDQVETVLFNILRGTGLAGLAGIPRVREFTEAASLVRPLLEVTRMEVLDYLLQSRAPFREDSSNASEAYTRNKIRRQLLPLLEREFNPHVREAISRLSRIAAESDEFIVAATRDAATLLLRPIAQGLEIRCPLLEAGSDFFGRTILMQAWRWQGWPEQDMGYDEWQALLLLARSPPCPDHGWLPPRMFPGCIRAEKQGGVLRLTRPG